MKTALYAEPLTGDHCDGLTGGKGAKAGMLKRIDKLFGKGRGRGRPSKLLTEGFRAKGGIRLLSVPEDSLMHHCLACNRLASLEHLVELLAAGGHCLPK